MKASATEGWSLPQREVGREFFDFAVFRAALPNRGTGGELRAKTPRAESPSSAMLELDAQKLRTDQQVSK